ncbi:MAG: hypothetical protein AAF686_04430 [Pseudomonadota bacterium]
MTLIVPNAEPTGLTTSIDSLERQLADMRRELEAMYDRIKAGEFGELKNAMKATTEIRQWLKIAIEAEAQLATREKRELGLHKSWGLDLSSAQEAIEFRLARLRRTRDAERVSGQS